jgi:hypothetical protein
MRPYPPSFSRMAARIIDPAIGASTCALGSHRCVENIGNFTMNPVTSISQKIVEFTLIGNSIIDLLINIEDELL